VPHETSVFFEIFRLSSLFAKIPHGGNFFLPKCPWFALLIDFGTNFAMTTRSFLLRLLSLSLVLVLCAIAYRATEDLSENSRLVWRIPIFVLGSAVIALMGVVFFLPAIADRIADFFYTSPERVEPDAGSKARALVAQGDYEGALKAYLSLAEQMPGDRLPVVEAMRLAREKLHDPPRALQILENAVEGRDWPEEDACYFLFRLVEIHEDDLQDKEAAAEVLQKVIEYFPGTRHAANASHKLQDWGMSAP
jgi:tetratricopeptide (TPR) repeat protein